MHNATLQNLLLETEISQLKCGAELLFMQNTGADADLRVTFKQTTSPTPIHRNKDSVVS